MSNKTSYVKNGSFYRREKGGSKFLRIRKQGANLDKPAKPKKSAKPAAPTTPLTPEQQRQKILENGLGDVTTPLTGSAMTGVADALVGLEYGPQYANLNTAEKKATTSGAAQAKWAQGYDRDAQAILDASKTQQDAANARSQQNLAAWRQQALGAAGGAVQGNQAAMAQDAGVRGSGFAGGTDAFNQAAQVASASAGAQGDAALAGGQARGDAQSAFLRSLGAAGALRGQENQAAIRNATDSKLSDIASQRSQLASSEGAARVKALTGLRSSETTNYLTQQSLASKEQQAILDYKLGIQKLTASAAIKKQERELALKLKRLGLSSAEAIAAARDATSTANNIRTTSTSTANNIRTNKKTGDKASFTPAQMRSAAGKRDDAIAFARALKTRKVNGKTTNRADALIALTQKYGSLFARVAVGTVYDGGAVGHLNTELQRRYGVQIPGRYRAKGKRANG